MCAIWLKWWSLEEWGSLWTDLRAKWSRWWLSSWRLLSFSSRLSLEDHASSCSLEGWNHRLSFYMFKEQTWWSSSSFHNLRNWCPCLVSVWGSRKELSTAIRRSRSKASPWSFDRRAQPFCTFLSEFLRNIRSWRKQESKWTCLLARSSSLVPIAWWS
jgi:hypothetical protein